MSRAVKRVRVAAVLIAIAVGLPACGGAAPHEATYVEPEREDPSALDDEQRELERALGEELARPELDCGAACDLGARICDLSERICGIATRHPRDTELERRCTDAGGRCDVARERVAERCACE